MRCSIISPTGRDEFQDIGSIHMSTTAGERELLTGHIALLAALHEGPSLRLRTETHTVCVTLAPGSFIQFARDEAEVLTTRYTLSDGS